ncbi:MAG: Mrp/NBP35 family ATP-binding protein [Lachnospiraceae bacterium]|jgi:Mrp family chromosome partitioning ATPase|nr:Mrp/NBP35 family ATP-binding protein [Lachnospiraceae bacterium]MCI9101278.1 Mrp/NBP35 family ATP-binding protein [Lachnospiraceae bacterium]MCI9357443.1 Mrp/NBP35 family ATP-binding protein [Lachnospiraceae bacterium]
MAKECDNSSCTKEDCAGCKEKKENGIPKEECNQFSKIRRVIGIVSGKGGVGKSFMAASLANQLAAKGYRVGIMDADVTGPSIPKMYGLKGAASADENGIRPMVTENGIKIISVNLLLPTEETPVIWRGPVIANMVKQFWTDVVWEEIDYLLVDMPPGTGDVPLTVFQSLPIDGVVIVTSPQDLVRMIVKKAYNMADMMHVPVLGIVENYSYVKCPDCNKELKVFGESHIDEIAGELNVPVLGKIPVDPEFASAADKGIFHTVQNEYLTDGVRVMPEIS